MKTRKFQIALIAMMMIGAVSTKMFAQTGEFKFGPAISLVVPTGDFSSMKDGLDKIEHDTGFGIAAAAKYGLNDFLSVVGELGWNTVSETITGTEKSYDTDYNFVNFTAGVRANVGFVYAEARAGYIGGDEGGFGFVPGIGGEFKNFDLQANYTIVGDASYFGMRLAYYFGL